MAINKQLAEQFTLQVLTSRDLEDGLLTIYRFLEVHFPLDVMNIHIYDAQRAAIQFPVVVTDDGVLFTDEKIKLTAAGQQGALDSLKHKVHVWEYPSGEPLLTEICEFFTFTETHSAIRAITTLDGSRYGGIGLDAFGVERYNKNHIQLMEDLFEALAGAVRHTVGQIDLSSQKKPFAYRKSRTTETHQQPNHWKRDRAQRSDDPCGPGGPS